MKMSDVLQWSAGLLALLGFSLWYWSVRVSVQQSDNAAISLLHRKRRIGRYAALAAGLSVLLLAMVLANAPAPRGQDNPGIILFALAAPTGIVG